MNRRLVQWIFLAAATLAVRTAAAQEVTIGYQGLPYKASGESNTGIQLSEGVLLHVGAGAEAGYDSNVFYSENPNNAAIYRASLFAEMTNATRTGTVSKQLSFDARAGVTYRRYQFIDALPNPADAGKFENSWFPTAGLALSAGSGQIGFGLADSFARIEDPPYNPSQELIIRNNNQASVEGRFSPGGGRLTAVLRYTNMIDIFEGNTYNFANSMTNTFMLDGAWKWLPKTAIFLNAQQGYILYFNEALAATNSKFSSYPLRVTTGLRGLLTEKTSAILSLGYMNGFYTNGTSTGGFLGSSFAELSFTIRPTMLSRIVAGYRHDFENAVISNFSYNETVYLSYVQQIAGRLALDLSGRYVHRNYQGYRPLGPATPAVDRNDEFFQVGATLDYFVRNWVFAGLGYSLMSNSSNLSVAAGVPQVDYLKQQMFVRLGLTY